MSEVNSPTSSAPQAAVASQRSKFLWRRVTFWVMAIALAWCFAQFSFAKDEHRKVSDGYVAATVTLVIGYALFYLFAWRCPGCRAHFGRDYNPAKCSNCGAGL